MNYTTESGEKVSTIEQNKIGEGGEAWIYRIDLKDHRYPQQQLIAKIYKGPTAPDYQGDTEQDRYNREGAKKRLATFSDKIKMFPKGLPDNVGSPLGILLKNNKPAGFYSRLVPEPRETLHRYCEVDFRQSGVDTNDVISMLANLYHTVDRSHKCGLIFGDFNDLNVLGPTPYIIDAESGSYGTHQCSTFTQRFADPLLCDKSKPQLSLIKPHTIQSDIYAYAIMVFQSLLYISPYDGKYKPVSKIDWCPHDARPLFRKTVFDKQTIYPKWATKLGLTPDILPDELVQHFIKIFHDDFRGDFPISIIKNMRWTKCSKCNTEHARTACPNCASLSVVTSVMEVKGTVVSERIFKTSGVILHAEYQNDHLRYIYHEGDSIKRDNGVVVIKGNPDPHVRYRINGDNTCLGKGNMLLTLSPNMPPAKSFVGTYNGVLPMFDANFKHRFWLDSGRLLSDKSIGAFTTSERVVGNILQEQTMFWVGEKFGFGFYRASELQEFFVFDCEIGTIKDGLSIGVIKGQLLDATCEFSKSHCWFFTSSQVNGVITNRCIIIDEHGNVLGTHEENSSSSAWLNSLRGKCALGNSLFSTTDDGIVRIECKNGLVSVTKSFPDTEPFVDENCKLFPGKDCLHVVTKNEIRKLRIN